jgi:hypothetical protein
MEYGEFVNRKDDDTWYKKTLQQWGNMKRWKDKSVSTIQQSYMI